MMPTQKGSFHLFRFAGVNVFLHWSWLVGGAIMLQYRQESYTSLTWNALEYLGLFGIVLLHEFGHSLACRQVGGRADQIVLWPLGGVAYVDPPQRPGATLWSIAAGPLVNVVLAPILFGLLVFGDKQGWPESMPNVFGLIEALFQIDVVLLIFNLLPIYPLDGGQMLRSLLWFFLGRAQSLMATTIIGFVGVALFIVFAVLTFLKTGFPWLCIMSAFMAITCWSGFQYARALNRMAKIPRHVSLACPGCKAAPPVGPFWVCGACQKPFDLFASSGTCPGCATLFNVGRCLDCGGSHPLYSWISSEPPAKL